MFHRNFSTRYSTIKLAFSLRDSAHVRRYYVTLINIDFVPKEMVSPRLLPEDSIKFIDYFRLFKHRYVCYLFFIRIKDNVNQII